MHLTSNRSHVTMFFFSFTRSKLFSYTNHGLGRRAMASKKRSRRRWFLKLMSLLDNFFNPRRILLANSAMQVLIECCTYHFLYGEDCILLIQIDINPTIGNNLYHLNRISPFIEFPFGCTRLFTTTEWRTRNESSCQSCSSEIPGSDTLRTSKTWKR